MLARLLHFTGLALLACLVVAASAGAAPTIEGEFDVSSVDSNTKIAAGPDGNVWLALAFNGGGKDVARVTPAGEVTEYDLQIEGAQGITSDANGFLWVTRNGGVTKFDPADPEGTKVSTIVPTINGAPIVAGPDGNLWAASNENLVRIPPGDPESSKAFPVAGLAPKDIDVAGSLLAIASQEHIVTATTGDPPVTVEYPISGLASQGVAGSPSGQIAFSDPLATPEKVGLITPPNQPQETELGGDPFGVTFGSDGAFWIARFATGSLTRLTSDNQMTELSGLPIEGPRQITTGPGNTLWVTVETKEGGGEEKPDKVVKVGGVENPPTGNPKTPPGTRIGKAPKKKVKTRHARARVKFRFFSEPPGASFECALTRLKKKGKGKAPKPRFKPCKSPKVYRVKPGRYRFQVRAVAEGLADPTPAKRSFRVVRKH